LTLIADKITLQRGQRVLLQDFSLSLSAGDGICIRGANGSGKTTLLRALAGLHEPRTGRIIRNEDDDGPAQISFLGHQDPIKAGQTVLKQLRFWASVSGNDGTDLADIARHLGITRQLDLQGGVLSAGQRKRTALARLLIEDRVVWLLDEPAAPLDVEGREILGMVLDEHRMRGGSFVAAVHDELPCQVTRTIWLDMP
jgi:heme exporter protein A